jgi:hypothetical protein
VRPDHRELAADHRAAEAMSAAPDAALSDLLDLIQQENIRFIEALEHMAGDLSALAERATAAKEALASVDSRLDHIEHRLGIPEP